MAYERKNGDGGMRGTPPQSASGPLPAGQPSRLAGAILQMNRTAGNQRVAQMLRQARQMSGGGDLLPAKSRERLAETFGTDLSEVRVHRSAEAHALSDSLQAKAFTVGNDIFFREGAYQPGTEAGEELLAHEVTHVIQQRAHPFGSTLSGSWVSRESDASEREANQAVQRMRAGETMTVQAAPSALFHRTPEEHIPQGASEHAGQYVRIDVPSDGSCLFSALFTGSVGARLLAGFQARLQGGEALSPEDIEREVKETVAGELNMQRGQFRESLQIIDANIRSLVADWWRAHPNEYGLEIRRDISSILFNFVNSLLVQEEELPDEMMEEEPVGKSDSHPPLPEQRRQLEIEDDEEDSQLAEHLRHEAEYEAYQQEQIRHHLAEQLLVRFEQEAVQPPIALGGIAAANELSADRMQPPEDLDLEWESAVEEAHPVHGLDEDSVLMRKIRDLALHHRLDSNSSLGDLAAMIDDSDVEAYVQEFAANPHFWGGEAVTRAISQKYDLQIHTHLFMNGDYFQTNTDPQEHGSLPIHLYQDQHQTHFQVLVGPFSAPLRTDGHIAEQQRGEEDSLSFRNLYEASILEGVSLENIRMEDVQKWRDYLSSANERGEQRKVLLPLAGIVNTMRDEMCIEAADFARLIELSRRYNQFKLVNKSWDRAKGEELSILHGEIAEELNRLAVKYGQPDLVAVPTEIQYHSAPIPGSGDELATGMEAIVSLSPGRHVGYEPADFGFWSGTVTKNFSGAFVRAHLLNKHLFGTGLSKNMMFLTDADNKKMSRLIEERVKEEVIANNRIVRFRVIPHFNQAKFLAEPYLMDERMAALVPESVSFLAQYMERTGDPEEPLQDGDVFYEETMKTYVEHTPHKIPAHHRNKFKEALTTREAGTLTSLFARRNDVPEDVIEEVDLLDREIVRLRRDAGKASTALHKAVRRIRELQVEHEEEEVREYLNTKLVELKRRYDHINAIETTNRKQEERRKQNYKTDTQKRKEKRLIERARVTPEEAERLNKLKHKEIKALEVMKDSKRIDEYFNKKRTFDDMRDDKGVQGVQGVQGESKSVKREQTASPASSRKRDLSGLTSRQQSNYRTLLKAGYSDQEAFDNCTRQKKTIERLVKDKEQTKRNKQFFSNFLLPKPQQPPEEDDEEPDLLKKRS